jgi:hypothetical protein
MVDVAELEEILNDIELKRNPKVRKLPDRDGIIGVVQGLQSNLSLGQYFYRPQHLAITPDFYKWLGIVFPLSRRFSIAGDSGAWLIDQRTSKWVGMIVGGYKPPNTSTIALLGCSVLEAFRQYEKVGTRADPILLI